MHRAVVADRQLGLAFGDLEAFEAGIGVEVQAHVAGDIGAHVFQPHRERGFVAGLEALGRLAFDRVECGGKRRSRTHGQRARERTIAFRPVDFGAEFDLVTVGDRTAHHRGQRYFHRAARLDAADLEHPRIALAVDARCAVDRARAGTVG